MESIQNLVTDSFKSELESLWNKLESRLATDANQEVTANPELEKSFVSKLTAQIESLRKEGAKLAEKDDELQNMTCKLHLSTLEIESLRNDSKAQIQMESSLRDELNTAQNENKVQNDRIKEIHHKINQNNIHTQSLFPSTPVQTIIKPQQHTSGKEITGREISTTTSKPNQPLYSTIIQSNTHKRAPALRISRIKLALRTPTPLRDAN